MNMQVWSCGCRSEEVPLGFRKSKGPRTERPLMVTATGADEPGQSLCEDFNPALGE
jgi:hypothetical protein